MTVVKVQLHGYTGCGPGRPGEVLDLLEGKSIATGLVPQDEPVRVIGRSVARGLVAWSIGQAQQLSVELCSPSDVDGVYDV